MGLQLTTKTISGHRLRSRVMEQHHRSRRSPRSHEQHTRRRIQVVTHFPALGEVHTAQDHHQLRVVVERPSAPMGIPIITCRPDRRQRALFPAVLRQWRDTGIRRCRLACFLPTDRRQEEHRRGCQCAQDAEVSLASPSTLYAATMAAI